LRVKSLRYIKTSIGNSMLFVRGAAHVKSIRIIRDLNQELFAFCTRRCVCKNYKDSKECQSGAP
jgi:hypothetical protein